MSKFQGRTLHVDLASGSHTRRECGEQTVHSYIGGRGLGARLLYDLLPPGTDPLQPENVLLFLTGPLTGTPLPGSGKYIVISKSPATGTFVDSHSSGLLGPAMRLAGFDVLVITGRAQEPSYLHIEDGQVRIRPAAELWGMRAFEAETRLRDRHGHQDVGVAVIGPAGENLVKFSSIGSDYYRHAARGGVGAIMGSKNLKAVVVRGTGKIPVADPDRVLALQARQIEKIGTSATAQSRIKYGTAASFAAVNAAGMLPTRNYQQGTFPEAAQRIDGEGVRSMTFANAGCYGCIMPCSRLTEAVRKGHVVRVEGPEYETVTMLGSNLGVSDPGVVIDGNFQCDELGIDVISAGNVIGFVMECVERGLLTEPSVADLRFGNGDAALRVLDDIAYRRGFGDLMAEGVRALAESIGGGAEHFAMHVKGLELPAYDPRAGFGTALTYAVTPRGGCHRRAWPPAKEVFGGVPPFTTDGKAAMVKGMFDDRAVQHSLVACDFHPGALPIPMTEYAEFVAAATGETYSAEEWAQASERIETTIRLINNREGFTRQDDCLPPRLLVDPLPEGASAGKLFGQEGLDRMLDEYYALRGWDAQGTPLPDTLSRLGISEPRGWQW